MHTITLCTTAFERMAELEREAMGVPGLQLAIVEHPVMGRDAATVEAAVDRLMPLLRKRFIEVNEVDS